MSRPWDARSLAAVYARMAGSGANFIVVGGQAINLWAEMYCTRGIVAPAVWQNLVPYTSRDLDCLGGSADALKVAAAYGVRPRIYGALGKAWVPNTADLELPVGDTMEPVLVQFLHTIKGVASEEAQETARELAWGGVTLRVLHPLLCLEGKLANLWELDQQAHGRQDLKHARICCLVMRAFIAEIARIK